MMVVFQGEGHDIPWPILPKSSAKTLIRIIVSANVNCLSTKLLEV
ncbi:Hypothetical protein Tpal_1120 [Trichococcus palustris]|uniref:Uncharacterized protein n=1 Tax=Trichococcus palustris TaxID=140314 RepID=A0A143YHX3_9LACT|nr:Hypothetical protein Tpal_1120 [Trichococcus palustris]SFL10961.1 hypothetical protein SAMN04488076_1209 [Trichococcus palustris]